MNKKLYVLGKLIYRSHLREISFPRKVTISEKENKTGQLDSGLAVDCGTALPSSEPSVLTLKVDRFL